MWEEGKLRHGVMKKLDWAMRLADWGSGLGER